MIRPDGLPLSRRELFGRIGGGFGLLGLAGAFADAGWLTTPAAGAEAAIPTDPLAPRSPHFTPRAKRVIFLFMNGGPSHLDTFDPKPELEKLSGQEIPESFRDPRRKAKGKLMPSPFKFAKHGAAGIDVSELFPEVAKRADDLCVIRSLYTDNPNHEPSLLMMNSGNMQPIRPSLGSWLTFGLGTENRNLPGFIVLCPGKPVVGPQLWSNSFLPGVFQGTHINNKSVDPDKLIRAIRNEHLTRAAQREQLDLVQTLNRNRLDERGGDEPWKPASRRSRSPSACSSRPARRSTSTASRRPRATSTARASSPTPA